MFEGIVSKDIIEIEKDLGLRPGCKIIGVEIVDGTVEFRFVSAVRYRGLVELNSPVAPERVKKEIKGVVDKKKDPSRDGEETSYV